MKSFRFGFCRCGCWKLTNIRRGKFNRYLLNHQSKGKHPANWKGGRHKRKNGYWILYIPNYFSSDKQGRIFEHVYFYQEFYKLCMLPWGEVHHKDGNRENNLPYFNLEGMMEKHHKKMHMIGNNHAKKKTLRL